MCQVIGRCVARRRTGLRRFVMQMDEERFLEFTDAFTEVDEDGDTLISKFPKIIVIGSKRHGGFDGVFSSYSGWIKLKEILVHPDCTMQELTIRTKTSTPREDVFELTSSLMQNSSLVRVHLPKIEVDVAGRVQLLKVVCNQESIDTILKSNHTIESITFQNSDNMDEDSADEDIMNENYFDTSSFTNFLTMNQEQNKKLVAWKKVLLLHFKGNYLVEPYFNTEIKMMRFMMAKVFDKVIATYDERNEDVIKRIEARKLNYFYRMIRYNPGKIFEDKISLISTLRKRKHDGHSLASGEAFHKLFVKQPGHRVRRRQPMN